MTKPSSESELIWPEWDDSSLNKESWHGATPVSSKSKARSEKDVGSFVDPSGHGLIPSDFEVACWKRPQDIEPNLTYTVAPQTSNIEEFISSNIHLLRSDLLQRIMLSYMNLDNAAQRSPFPTEYTNSKFFPSFDKFWKPWYHIYSLCKAGKGHAHKPIYNPYGKYIIRVFLVGRWRRIDVDDFLPVDSEGRVLLPLTKRREDLWLPLLTKALLKIVLSSKSVTINVISCLTGWVEMPVNCANIDRNLLWKSLERHLKHDSEVSNVGENEIEMCITEPPYCLHQQLKMPNHYPYSPLIVTHFSTLPSFNREDCINYGAIIDFKDDDEGLLDEDKIVLENWKIYRWREWAIKNGILKDSVNNPGRKVLIFTPNNVRKVQFLIPGNRVSIETDTDEPALNLLLWVKMDTLVCSLRKLSFFYKPSEFKHSKLIDNFQEFLTSALNPKESIQPTPKKTAKKIEVKNTLSQPVIDTSMNSFYLVCDTLYCKIFFISFEGFSKTKDISEGYSIIGEKFTWERQTIGKALFSIHLHSPQTVTKLLGSGLQILRIWCNLPKNYALRIFSYSEFTLCSREKVYQIMALPSIAVKYFAHTSSNLFAALINKSSNSNAHGEAYKKFIDSLEPKYFSRQVKSSKDRSLIRLNIIQTFEELAIDMLLEKKTNPDEFIRCLLEFQKLFLNPGFGEKYLMMKNQELFEQFLKEEERRKQMNKSKISQHSLEPSAKENQLRFFEKNTYISTFYPYTDCKEYEMSYVDYSGSYTLAEPETVILILRYIINVDHVDKKPYVFQMFTNCPIGLAMVNNDTNEGNSSILSESANFQVSHNEHGYTLLVFTSEGKCPEHISWKLRIIGSRDYPLPYSFSPIHGRTDLPPLTPLRRGFEGLYIPDKESNIFCKCMLKVKNSCALSLALISSSLLAELTLKIRGHGQKIITEHTNIHRVYLPFIFLDASEGIESVDGDGWSFLIEAQVEKNSWLLSEENKTALKDFRDSEASRRLKKPAKKSSYLDFHGIDQMPTWHLRACFDQEAGDPQLLPDTQIADELRRQKENWVSAGDEAQLLEALQCQQKFLEDYPEDYANAWKSHHVSQQNGANYRIVQTGDNEEKEVSRALLTRSVLDEYSKVEKESPTATQKDEAPLSTDEIIERTNRAIDLSILRGQEYVRMRGFKEMRKLRIESVLIITLCIIGNADCSVDLSWIWGNNKHDDGVSNPPANKSESKPPAPGPAPAPANVCKDPNDQYVLKKSTDEKMTQLANSAVQEDALAIVDRMSPEVVEVEDEVAHKCDQPQCQCPKNDHPCTVPATTAAIEVEEAVSVSPSPRLIRNGNGIAFKYEVDFATPLFGMRGFRGAVAAGYITPKSKAENVEAFKAFTTYTEGTTKIFLVGEFGLIKKDNTTWGITGEVFLELKFGQGEVHIGFGMKVTTPFKSYGLEKEVGNYMKESPPFCITIPQIAGIRFCQVAFDFIFRTNFTGSACIQTEIKHLVCPLPLVTIQYHCLNFNGRKFFITKTTRKSGVINPKEIYTSYTRRNPSPNNKNGKGKDSKGKGSKVVDCKGKQAQPPSTNQNKDKEKNIKSSTDNCNRNKASPSQPPPSTKFSNNAYKKQ
ncbi:uncharacterized protein LOC111047439 isoform X2 [Nilaparvata lugens]|uniref:uncharacterized protein LOC111047439 isoform X2 n=1 Tax=Nilaparvata lugens TaxID=108931 RepID=UPI00193D112F|nr:uncharacterized protein LOC111047439 isoform X2 [Nilaparvata lugens]